MKNYSIYDALEIIDECDINNLYDTRHSQIRNIQRTKNYDEVYNAILYEKPVGIIKEDYGKFLVIYPCNNKPSRDLYIVLIITSNKDIKFITVMTKSKYARVK